MSVLLHFEEYQKARVKFVQAIAEAATRPQNIEVMNNAGVMQLLRPLLLDNVPSIQQTAALALGRLANYSEDLAEAVVGNEILPQLVYSLSDQNVSAKSLSSWGGGFSSLSWPCWIEMLITYPPSRFPSPFPFPVPAHSFTRLHPPHPCNCFGLFPSFQLCTINHNGT